MTMLGSSLEIIRNVGSVPGSEDCTAFSELKGNFVLASDEWGQNYSIIIIMPYNSRWLKRSSQG